MEEKKGPQGLYVAAGAILGPLLVLLLQDCIRLMVSWPEVTWHCQGEWEALASSRFSLGYLCSIVSCACTGAFQYAEHATWKVRAMIGCHAGPIPVAAMPRASLLNV